MELFNQNIDFCIEIKLEGGLVSELLPNSIMIAVLGEHFIKPHGENLYHILQRDVFLDENKIQDSFLEYKKRLIEFVGRLIQNKKNLKANLLEWMELLSFDNNSDSNQYIFLVSLKPVFISNELKGKEYFAHEYNKYIPFKFKFYKTDLGYYSFIDASSKNYSVLDGFGNFEKEPTCKWENGCGDYAYLPCFENKMNDTYNTLNINDGIDNILSFKTVDNKLKFEFNKELLNDLFGINEDELQDLINKQENKFNKANQGESSMQCSQ